MAFSFSLRTTWLALAWVIRGQSNDIPGRQLPTENTVSPCVLDVNTTVIRWAGNRSHGTPDVRCYRRKLEPSQPQWRCQESCVRRTASVTATENQYLYRVLPKQPQQKKTVFCCIQIDRKFLKAEKLAPSNSEKTDHFEWSFFVHKPPNFYIFRLISFYEFICLGLAIVVLLRTSTA